MTPNKTSLGQATAGALQRALRHAEDAQDASGAWPGEYAGPGFLLPMFVATTHGIGAKIDEETRAGIERRLRRAQNADGGWGLHEGAPSMVMDTALSYVALRLLGVKPDQSVARETRRWLTAHGGPLASAFWGKFLLAVLNLHHYDGLIPTPPELWLLPPSVPAHPSQLYSHSRVVYLAMSWLYGRRAQLPPAPLTEQLRSELYPQPYESIAWAEHRLHVAETDELTPWSKGFRRLVNWMIRYERRPRRRLRERACTFALEQIRHEDRNTGYICLSPVSKLFHTLVWHFAAPDGDEVKRHLRQLPEYLWRAGDAVNMQAYHSTRLWDTALMAHAVHAAGEHDSEMSRRARAFIAQNQIQQEIEQRKTCYRDARRGGWSFSRPAHGWPTSLSTSACLSALLLPKHQADSGLGVDGMCEAVDLILSMQNSNGGWATYEKTRGPGWLEQLNPSSCFGAMMNDAANVESTSFCLQALTQFTHRHPGFRDKKIEKAVSGGREYLLSTQREDGSWYGTRGICFTHGTWCGITGLRSAGLPPTHSAIGRARQFLESRQLADGGWGESVESSRRGEYATTREGAPVMTSWALLALVAAGADPSGTVERGVLFLIERQGEDGSWSTDQPTEVFAQTCALRHANDAQVFPLWALAIAGQLLSSGARERTSQTTAASG